jgi:uncharacterized membrane protein
VGVNQSRIERALRVAIGAALLGVGLLVVTGPIGIVLDLIGAVLVFSGATGFCHVYRFFGICTATKKPR